MTTKFTYLYPDGSVIQRVVGSPQPPSANYVEMDETDARYVAWETDQSKKLAYKAAIIAGVVITSATAGISGTYAVNDSITSKIADEQLYIAAKGTFTNGQTSRGWPDVGGILHVFQSTAEFTLFAETAAAYRDALETAFQTPGAWVAPAMPAAIA